MTEYVHFQLASFGPVPYDVDDVPQLWWLWGELMTIEELIQLILERDGVVEVGKESEDDTLHDALMRRWINPHNKTV